MELKKLTHIIFSESCRHYFLQDIDSREKSHLIRTAILLAITTKETQYVTFNGIVEITLRLQPLSRLIERAESFPIYVEYGYQNSRIYNLDSLEKITLLEMTQLKFVSPS